MTKDRMSEAAQLELGDDVMPPRLSSVSDRVFFPREKLRTGWTPHPSPFPEGEGWPTKRFWSINENGNSIDGGCARHVAGQLAKRGRGEGPHRHEEERLHRACHGRLRRLIEAGDHVSRVTAKPVGTKGRRRILDGPVVDFGQTNLPERGL